MNPGRALSLNSRSFISILLRASPRGPFVLRSILPCAGSKTRLQEERLERAFARNELEQQNERMMNDGRAKKAVRAGDDAGNNGGALAELYQPGMKCSRPCRILLPKYFPPR